MDVTIEKKKLKDQNQHTGPFWVPASKQMTNQGYICMIKKLEFFTRLLISC